MEIIDLIGSELSRRGIFDAFISRRGSIISISPYLVNIRVNGEVFNVGDRDISGVRELCDYVESKVKGVSEDENSRGECMVRDTMEVNSDERKRSEYDIKSIRRDIDILKGEMSGLRVNIDMLNETIRRLMVDIDMLKMFKVMEEERKVKDRVEYIDRNDSISRGKNVISD